MKLSLRPYRAFDRIPFPKSYLGKFLLVAFLGVHVPLIALIAYVATAHAADWRSALPILVVALVATLVGTGATLIIQRWLLAPLLHTSRALEEYRQARIVPALPTDCRDEAGQLMAITQGCISHLESLLRMKNDLLSIISHDTRNPLTQIMMASELMGSQLASTSPDFMQVEYMNGMVREGAKRQLRLIDNLMRLVHAEQQSIAPEFTETRPAEVLRMTMDSSRLQAENKGVILMQGSTLTQGGKNILDEPIVLDIAKTEQVLNNLVHNAIKFTKAGGKVTLDAGEEGTGAERALVFSVRDSGIGMNEKVQQGLFKPFTRGRAGTSGEASSGLGLWICKTFIEAQGGAVTVESTAGEGSTFKVRLPWRKPSTAEGARGHGAEAPVAGVN